MYKRLQTRLAVDLFAAKRLIARKTEIEKWSKVIPDAVDLGNDQHVDWHLTDSVNKPVDMEFYLMKCGAKTEYCTEVHLLVKMQDSIDPEAVLLAESVLEALRVKTNKDWVIKDADLNSGIFRSN